MIREFCKCVSKSKVELISRTADTESVNKEVLAYHFEYESCLSVALYVLHSSRT